MTTEQDSTTPGQWEAVTREHKAIVRTVADSHIGKIALMQSRQPLHADAANAQFIVTSANAFGKLLTMAASRPDVAAILMEAGVANEDITSAGTD